MPQIALAGAIAGGSAFVGGVTLGGLGVVGSALAIGGLAAGGTFLQQRQLRKAFSAQAQRVAEQGTLVNIRAPALARRIVIGEARVGGVITDVSTTGDASELLNLFLVIGDGEMGRLIQPWIGKTPVILRSDGVVEEDSGRYAESATIVYGAGAESQGAFAFPDRDGGYRLQGIAGAFIQLTYDPELYPSIPEITLHVEGLQVEDPRTSVTRWSQNPALVLRDRLLADPVSGGAGWSADVLDETSFAAAANACDEIVDVPPRTFSVMANAAGALEVADLDCCPVRTGDRVSVGGTVYYAITDQPRREDDEPPTFKVASSLSDARSGVAQSASGASATHTGEPRYTVDGLIDFDGPVSDWMQRLLDAMDGRLVRSGGTWRLLAGVWRAPVGDPITEADLLGPLEFETIIARTSRVTRVEGRHISHLAHWSPVAIVPQTDAAYVTSDGGIAETLRLDLPLTLSATMAQRLARIVLRRAREPTTIALQGKLRLLDYRVGDNVTVTLARYGMTAKTFEVESRELVMEPSREGGAKMTVSMRLRSVSQSIWEWTSADGTLAEIVENQATETVQETWLTYSTTRPAPGEIVIAIPPDGVDGFQWQTDGVLPSTPTIQVSSSSLSFQGGSSASFTVSLSEQPVGDVDVEITENIAGVWTLTSNLTFTPESWNTPQTVVVAASEGTSGTLTLTASGASTDSTTISVNVSPEPEPPPEPP